MNRSTEVLNINSFFLETLIKKLSNLLASKTLQNTSLCSVFRYFSSVILPSSQLAKLALQVRRLTSVPNLETSWEYSQQIREPCSEK
jgi:hypothetical protein